MFYEIQMGGGRMNEHEPSDGRSKNSMRLVYAIHPSGEEIIFLTPEREQQRYVASRKRCITHVRGRSLGWQCHPMSTT